MTIRVDMSDDIMEAIKYFPVGLLLRDAKRGAQVLGSGVLASIAGRKGILTCGHVAEVYDKQLEIGAVRFLDRYEQRHIVNISDAFTVILESGPDWTQTGADLAFTLLTPDAAAGIESRGGAFKNLEKNGQTLKARNTLDSKHIDATMGLIEERSEKPFVAENKLVSVVHGILHTGNVVEQENGSLTLKAMDYNAQQLPKDFGGMSGAGLWRVYYEIEAEKPVIKDIVLIGVVSYQIDGEHLACQGWDRIEQALIPQVMKEFKLS